MRYAPLFLIAFFTLLLAAQDVQAQGRSDRSRDRDDDRWEHREDRGRHDRGRHEDDRKREGDYYDDDWHDDDEGRRRGRGPAFCRSGEGHPVHGRAWCLEKGFGLGNDDRYDDAWDDDDRYRDYDRRRSRWRRVRADDVFFHTGFFDRFRDRFDEDDLRRVLGRETFYRLRDHQRRLRLRGELSGRFDDDGLLDRGGRTLRVYADGRALARFIDHDGDERVDRVLLRRR